MSRRHEAGGNTRSSAGIRGRGCSFTHPPGSPPCLVPATIQIRENIAPELPRFRAIRDKHGMAVPDDEEHLRALTAEGRVLLAITPDGPPSSWTCWGWD